MKLVPSSRLVLFRDFKATGGRTVLARVCTLRKAGSTPVPVSLEASHGGPARLAAGSYKPMRPGSTPGRSNTILSTAEGLPNAIYSLLRRISLLAAAFILVRSHSDNDKPDTCAASSKLAFSAAVTRRSIRTASTSSAGFGGRPICFPMR